MGEIEAENGMLPFDLSLPEAETYEVGAYLLAVLAVPEDPAKPADDSAAETDRLLAAQQKRVEKRLSIYLSLCAWALRLIHDDPDNWAHITARPQYCFRDLSLIEDDIGFTVRQVGMRMVAGRMAVPFLMRSAGLQVGLPTGVQRLSVNELAKFVQEDAGQADSENVEKRYWRTSRSVIHLCVAAVVVGQLRLTRGLTNGLELFLLNREHLAMVLAWGEDYALLIKEDREFPVPVEKLIRLPTA
jgi:hypothetical protein